MEDFNDYANRNESNEPNNKSLIEMVTSLASKFDGKSQNELLKAIYDEAEKGKRAGTLTNNDLDNFAAFISPMIDDKKRKMLFKLVEKLKEI